MAKKKKYSTLVLVCRNTRTKENVTLPIENLEIAEGFTLWDVLEKYEQLNIKYELLKAKLNELTEAHNSLVKQFKTQALATKLEINDLKED